MNIIEDIKTLQSQAQNKTNQPKYSQSNIEMLKAQLRFVCDKIEESLIQAMTPQHPQKDKDKEPIYDPQIEEQQYPIAQTINNYKELIQQCKYRLETIYDISKVEALESEVKAKREQLKEFNAENSTLIQLNQNQERGIKEYEDKYNNKKEVMQLTNQLKTLKEDTKMTKDYLKGIDAQLKGQMSQISVFKEKCQIIKENIEYKKKLQMKEVQNLIDDHKDTITDLSALEEQKASIENQVLIEEKGYKTEVNNQIDIIDRLKSEIDILVVRIKQLEQSKRVNELKMKEIAKLNQRERERDNNNKRESKNNNKHSERTSNNDMKMFKMKITKNKDRDREKEEMNLMSKTPNIKMNNKMMKKPFEIHKFNNETNYTEKKPIGMENKENNNKNEDNSNNDNDMIREIENLKNEIQSVIQKNNAHLAQIPLIPKEKILINKLNEQSAILPLDVESNHLEIKNEEEFEYLKDIEADESNSPKEHNHSKSKPFLAINFGIIK